MKNEKTEDRLRRLNKPELPQSDIDRQGHYQQFYFEIDAHLND